MDSLYAFKFKLKGKDQPYKTALVVADDEGLACVLLDRYFVEHEFDVDRRALCFAGDSVPITHEVLVLNINDIEDVLY